MFETNTASCGGFSGLSDSFAAALWSVDYNLNMAVNNFTNALYHVGGQRAYYNVGHHPFDHPFFLRSTASHSHHHLRIKLSSVNGPSDLSCTRL
jgi:hypothetical protein